jgi:hypothetical protein
VSAVDLVALDDVRAHLQLQVSETEQDPVIEGLITRVSVAIARHCGREFAPAIDSATRRFRLRPNQHHAGLYVLGLAPYDLRTATAVRLHPETPSPATLTADSHYTLDPANPIDGVYTSLQLWPPAVTWTSTAAINFGYVNIEIDGAWGFDEVPEDVKQACILATAAAMREHVQAFGGALQPNSIGEGVNDAIALPPGVRGLLTRYVRSPVF